MSNDRKVSVTEAARRFSDLINRVFYRGESTTLVRGGQPVARLVPLLPVGCSARELADRWAAFPHLEAGEALALERELEESRRALPELNPPWE